MFRVYVVRETAQVELKGVRVSPCLQTAWAAEGPTQQLLAEGSGEVRPRVPAQLDAKLHARAAPRISVHSGGVVACRWVGGG